MLNFVIVLHKQQQNLIGKVTVAICKKEAASALQESKVVQKNRFQALQEQL